MKENRLFLDIHVIQILPPSNVNRDDTGSPKTAVYGGVRRARVSSQSWKRAIRRYFLEESYESVGIRSLDVVRYLSDTILRKEPSETEESALKKAERIFNDAGITTKEHKTKALFFLGKKQAELLADAALNGETDRKKLQQIFNNNPSLDIALFGRMVADDLNLNEDASSQVAHAISTHEVRTEFDYYTAVDDLTVEESAGAGMLGTIEYNSSTLYRYANVAVHDLVKQLGDREQAINAVKLFIQAFANSMPTGKINTFANQTLPQLLMISIRTDRPVSLVTAFENPVKANSASGYTVPSIERLFDEMKKVEKFVEPAKKTFYVTTEDINRQESAEESDSLTALMNDFVKYAGEML